MYKSNVYNAKNINNKNIDNIKNINFSNEKKNTLILTSVEVIDELLNNFFKNQIDKKLAFLFYHNIYSKYSCDKVIEIILSKLIFIKINFYQLKLYKSPLFFLVKKIIKNLPFVSEKDKKILWDRIFLFLRSFDIEITYDKKIIPSDIVFSDIKYDDPVEFIKREIADFLRIYNINKSINIYIDNLDAADFDLINKIYNFLNIIFSDFIQFKFVAQIYKMELIQNLSKKFPGNNDYTTIINFVFKNSCNYFICDETENSY